MNNKNNNNKKKETSKKKGSERHMAHLLATYSHSHKKLYPKVVLSRPPGSLTRAPQSLLRVHGAISLLFMRGNNCNPTKLFTVGILRVQ
jgi:hypothetical protein